MRSSFQWLYSSTDQERIRISPRYDLDDGIQWRLSIHRILRGLEITIKKSEDP